MFHKEGEFGIKRCLVLSYCCRLQLHERDFLCSVGQSGTVRPMQCGTARDCASHVQCGTVRPMHCVSKDGLVRTDCRVSTD